MLTLWRSVTSRAAAWIENAPVARDRPNHPVAQLATELPSSDEEGWRSERRGGAESSMRRTNSCPPLRDTSLSRGERVARDGAFSSRRGSGEGSLHCHTHPAQNTNNSGNELHDLLQSKALTSNDPSKRTVSEAQNELLVGVHESVGPACPIHEPTPHPSCSGWRKRRSPTPSPSGEGCCIAWGEGAPRRRV